jgi:RNA-directed DNA polymerase
MQSISSIGRLAGALKTSMPELWHTLRKVDRSYREMIIRDAARPEKERPIVDAKKPLKTLQKRFLKYVLEPSLERSTYSHGGVPSRSIVSNVLPHCASTYIFKADIADFYPKIHHSRIVRLFRQLGCPNEVAQACARLCTFRNHLAQGLVTSPILADCLLQPVDKQIGVLCERIGLEYTRFVDDLTISGPFNFEDSGIPQRVQRILEVHGFEFSERKKEFSLRTKTSVTGLSLRKGRPDVESAYVDTVIQQLRDAESLSRGQSFAGPTFFTQSQLWGRVRFICWVNPNRRRTLVLLLARINWKSHQSHAIERGLIAFKKQTIVKDWNCTR